MPPRANYPYPGETFYNIPTAMAEPVADYLGPERTLSLYGKTNNLIERAYASPMAQAQQLRDHQRILPDFPGKIIYSPDAQSQTEQGYTQPIQNFGVNNPNQVGSVSGASIPSPVSSQPNLVQAQSSTPITTGMPWNY
ncbi:MAG: hypothetical protein ACRDFB_06400 [Rhabdochlamydiaceae bacterium]